VLHLRTVEADSKDEYNGKIDESGGRDASPSAWDFWVSGNSKLIHKEASMVYVLDQDDRVLNAVMISTESQAWWGKEYFAEAAVFLHSQGAWKSADGQLPGPVDAARSTGTTNTRTINRDETVENTNTAADWYVTVTSGLTPGRANNTGRYQN